MRVLGIWLWQVVGATLTTFSYPLLHHVLSPPSVLSLPLRSICPLSFTPFLLSSLLHSPLFLFSFSLNATFFAHYTFLFIFLSYQGFHFLSLHPPSNLSLLSLCFFFFSSFLPSLCIIFLHFLHFFSYFFFPTVFCFSFMGDFCRWFWITHNLCLDILY